MSAVSVTALILYPLARGTATGARHNGGVRFFWQFGTPRLESSSPFANVCQVSPHISSGAVTVECTRELNYTAQDFPMCSTRYE